MKLNFLYTLMGTYDLSSITILLYCKQLFIFICFPALHHCVLSCLSRIQLFETLWGVTSQDPQSMRFSRQKLWSGLPCHPSRRFSQPRYQTHVSCISTLQMDSLPLRHFASFMFNMLLRSQQATNLCLLILSMYALVNENIILQPSKQNHI